MAAVFVERRIASAAGGGKVGRSRSGFDSLSPPLASALSGAPGALLAVAAAAVLWLLSLRRGDGQRIAALTMSEEQFRIPFEHSPGGVYPLRVAHGLFHALQ